MDLAIEVEIGSPARCARCGRPSTAREPIVLCPDLGVCACSECAIKLRARHSQTSIKLDVHGWLSGEGDL